MAHQKPTSKEALQVELNSLLAGAHGEIKDAAEKIAGALDELIKSETNQNRKMFENAVQQAMTIPNSEHFMSADKQVKQAMVSILEHAREVVDLKLNDLTAANAAIKEQKKKLKERIEEIEHVTKRRGM